MRGREGGREIERGREGRRGKGREGVREREGGEGRGEQRRGRDASLLDAVM